MVDWQRYIDLRDINVRHNAGFRDIKDFLILRFLRFGESKPSFFADQRFVILFRFLDHPIEFLAFHVGDFLRVYRERLRLMKGVPPVTDRRIRHQTDTDDQGDRQYEICPFSYELFQRSCSFTGHRRIPRMLT